MPEFDEIEVNNARNNFEIENSLFKKDISEQEE